MALTMIRQVGTLKMNYYCDICIHQEKIQDTSIVNVTLVRHQEDSVRVEVAESAVCKILFWFTYEKAVIQIRDE